MCEKKGMHNGPSKTKFAPKRVIHILVLVITRSGIKIIMGAMKI
jgi:hypothetical protein